MMWVAYLAEMTAKAMSAPVVHFCLTVDALVGQTERQTQVQAHCNSDHLVVTSLTTSCRPREATDRALSHASDSLVATAIRVMRGFQESLLESVNPGGIPGPLAVGSRSMQKVGARCVPGSRWFWP